ncbi:MAG TPA: hypothetical protein VEJ84_20825 [Acidimicrobiales bacterium]|nr:hypothetical protein [Acidimicrobiales bacterium]
MVELVVALSCIVPEEKVLLAEAVVALKPAAPAGEAKLSSKAQRMPTTVSRLQRRTRARAGLVARVGGRFVSIGRPVKSCVLVDKRGALAVEGTPRVPIG